MEANPGVQNFTVYNVPRHSSPETLAKKAQFPHPEMRVRWIWGGEVREGWWGCSGPLEKYLGPRSQLPPSSVFSQGTLGHRALASGRLVSNPGPAQAGYVTLVNLLTFSCLNFLTYKMGVNGGGSTAVSVSLLQPPCRALPPPVLSRSLLESHPAQWQTRPLCV